LLVDGAACFETLDPAAAFETSFVRAMLVDLIFIEPSKKTSALVQLT
jgi:hypothetical protein